MPKRILTPINRQMIAEIAVEEGLFPKQVEDIIMSQFEYMKENISIDQASQFKLPYLGKFYVGDRIFTTRREHLDKKYGST